MRNVWAVARVTVREAVRQKYLRDAAHEHSTAHDHIAGTCNPLASASETNASDTPLPCKTYPETPPSSVTLVSLSRTTSVWNRQALYPNFGGKSTGVFR